MLCQCSPDGGGSDGGGTGRRRRARAEGVVDDGSRPIAETDHAVLAAEATQPFRREVASGALLADDNTAAAASPLRQRPDELTHHVDNCLLVLP